MSRRAALTGASSGIGLATAQAFAAAGYEVHGCDVGDRPNGPLASFVHLDVRDGDAIAGWIAELAAHGDGLHVVCSVAGIYGRDQPLRDQSAAEADELIDVNLRGAVNVARAASTALADGGALLFVASTAAFQAQPGGAVYAATKAATVGLARSLAAELAPRRIRVNVVSPGGIDTPLARRAFPDDAASDFAEYAAANPLGRIGRPEDVAAAMVFLAAAAHITGVVLRVDGGDGLGGAL